MGVTKTNHKVKVSFSAVPNVWNQEDTAYLCISGGEENAVPIREQCRWDGGRLIADVTLNVADGYELCFAVEHPGGSQELQVLEDKRLQMLAQECAIPMKLKRGSISYENGTLTLTNFTANFTIPRIYENQTSEPSIIYCEYRLYRRPQNDSKYELIRADVMDQLVTSTLEDYRFQTSGQEIRFKNVDLKNCNHLRLEFYVKFSSGVERELPVTILLPDGKGGVTE